ncbi:MAG: ABC transporter substrate-binding protein [Nitrospiraceae bacterium]|nr:ABC transporter substrate-binding protein [Nitrospiraceae bacterium]
MNLRIGHLSTFYHTAVLLMSGLAGDCLAGVEIKWKLFGTGPAIVEAFRQDAIDLAYIGLPPAVIGMEQGVRIKCIAGGHMEGTVVSGGADIKGYPELPGLGAVLGQLKGFKIGVPGRGSIHDVILSDALERSGLRGEVGVMNFKWADAITEALIKGQVRAAIGTPALAVAIRRYAGGKVLVPPHLIWPGNPSYGIVAASRFLDAHPGVIENFLKKHEEATEMMRRGPGLCAQRIASCTGVVDADFVLETIGISPRYCAQLTREYIDTTMDFVRAMKMLGYIGRELREDEIFDTSFICRVHPPGDHYGPIGNP